MNQNERSGNDDRAKPAKKTLEDKDMKTIKGGSCQWSITWGLGKASALKPVLPVRP